MTRETEPGTKTLDANDVCTTRISRRAAIQAVGAASVAIAVLGLEPEAAAAQGYRGCTDGDPYDPKGFGRRCTSSAACSDADPYDPTGLGRACGYTACSDADGYDPRGRGRWCGGGYCSDTDPYDASGYGRSCAQARGCHPCRGITDYDGRDPVGCGCQPGYVAPYCHDGDPYDGTRGRRC